MLVAGFVVNGSGIVPCEAVDPSLPLSILRRNSPLALLEAGDITVASKLFLLDALCRGGGGGGIAA